MKLRKLKKALRNFTRINPEQRGTLLRRRIGGRLGNLLALLILDRTEWLSHKKSSKSQGKDFIKTEFYLSCIPHPTTGSGHRFSEWLSALRMADVLGVAYLNGKIGQKWDQIYGTDRFQPIEKILLERKPLCVRMPRFPGDDDMGEVLKWFEKQKPTLAAYSNVLLLAADGQSFYRLADDFQRIRRLYYLHNQNHPKKDLLKVAVHVRRGDVALMKADGRGDWERRFLPNEWFLNIIKAVERVFKEMELNHQFFLFSQGKVADFPEFRELKNIELCLQYSAEESFKKMVESDVLIGSPSSFSFNAGLFSRNIKIFKAPWWHEFPSGDDWLLVRQNMELPQLEFLLKSKVEKYCTYNK